MVQWCYCSTGRIIITTLLISGILTKLSLLLLFLLLLYTGREYWLHQISGESQWERPSDESGQGELGGAGHNRIYDTNASHYSATAGDYTIEL